MPPRTYRGAYRQRLSTVIIALQLQHVVAHPRRVVGLRGQRHVAPELAAGFAVSFGLASGADKHMSDKFSDFWHLAQPDLREALRRARVTVQIAQASAPPPLSTPTSPTLPLSGETPEPPGNGGIRPNA